MNSLLVLLYSLGMYTGGLPQLSELGDTGPYSRSAKGGDHLYVAAFSGIHVFDVTDPDNPAAITHIPTEGGALDVKILGSHLIIADGSGLLIWDISAPAAPTPVTTWVPKGAPAGNINLLRLSGNIVFLVDLQLVYAVDLTDPANPAELDVYDAGTTIFSMDLAGSRIFLTQAAGEVHLLDATNPGALKFERSFVPGFSALGIAVSGDIAYIGDLTTLNLAIWDTAPATPVELGRTGLSGVPLWDLQLAGQHLYVPINNGGMSILDVTDPTNPTLAGSIGTDDLTRHIALDGTTAYLSDFLAGMRSVDIIDPTMPVERGAAGSGNVADRFARAGHLGYASDFGPVGSRIIQIYDLTDHANPVPLGQHATVQISDMEATGSLLYVAENTSGLKVLDNTDPNNPAVAGTVAGTYTGIDLANGFLFAAGNNSVFVFDLSDPNQPVELTELMLNRPRDIQVIGHRAYVADRTRGLVILDVSNPNNLTIVGEQTTQSTGSQRIHVSGDRAFLPNAGLNIMDITDETKPQLLGFLEGNYADVIYEQGLLYVAESVSGLNIYELDGTTLNLECAMDTPGNSSVLFWEPGRITLSDSVGGRHYIYQDVARYERLLQGWPLMNVLTISEHVTGQGALGL